MTRGALLENSFSDAFKHSDNSNCLFLRFQTCKVAVIESNEWLRISIRLNDSVGSFNVSYCVLYLSLTNSCTCNDQVGMLLDDNKIFVMQKKPLEQIFWCAERAIQ